MTKKPKHDQLFKRIMTNEIAAQEFLEYYLPSDFKENIDLSKITIEKESYIEENLREKFSDIVYSVKTKSDETAFIYILLDHQSTIDYWIALRLWKYGLLLCERHQKNKDKLPLICPILMYNGTEIYNAPRNLWDLFTDSRQAKKLMTENYQLVDLQSMSDDEIVQKKHLGMLEYIMKHIHQRDMIKLWDEFLSRFKTTVIIDKESGYVYMKSFLWYTDAKVPEDKQQELERIITKHLSNEEKENLMRTIAEKYIDQGIEQGIVQGIQLGKAEGKAELIKMMFAQGKTIDEIVNFTGLSREMIKNLKIT